MKATSLIFPHTAMRIVLATSLIFSLQACSEKAPPILATYAADQISPSTYVIHGPPAAPNAENQGFMNNPAFILGEAGIVVIDSGGTVQTGEMVLKLIKSISDLPVVATIATHIHGDHWLGNQAISAAYPQARHYAHALQIEQANSGEGQAWVDIMATLTEGASLGTEYIAPTEALNDGDQIQLAGLSFTIYHDPIVHTDSDIAIRFDADKVLFLGDTVINGQLRRIDDGNFKGTIAFLDRMLGVEAEHFVPGHGQSGGRNIVEQFKGMLSTILDTVSVEYENGLSDFEIKPLIEAQLIEAGLWSDLDEALGKFVSLAYLEVEADSF